MMLPFLNEFYSSSVRLDRSATGFGNLFITILLLTAVNLALLFEVQFSKPEIDKDIDIYMCWKSTFFFFFC